MIITAIHSATPARATPVAPKDVPAILPPIAVLCNVPKRIQSSCRDGRLRPSREQSERPMLRIAIQGDRNSKSAASAPKRIQSSCRDGRLRPSREQSERPMLRIAIQRDRNSKSAASAPCKAGTRSLPPLTSQSNNRTTSPHGTHHPEYQTRYKAWSRATRRAPSATGSSVSTHPRRCARL